jgi:MFS family permease
MATGKLKSLSKFPKVFWVVQTFEMMERGAYYTMVPILAYHVVFNVGAPPWLGGLIFAFMYPFQYGLPIFTGALAEKIGYRRQMIFAFSFLTIAYFFLFTAFNTVTIILAVMAVGIGIGSYKPLVSATVAKCTSSEDRNLAYGIYYWVVNLAASVFPIMFVIVMWAGLITEATYNIVFLVGGVMVSINIFTAIFVFKEVPRSGKVKTVGDAINNIKLALSDKKFVVMVILIGGFWAQYATMLFAIQIIGFGYHWFPSFITAMVLGIPNPLTIIALGPFISKFIEKIESMRVILGGLTVYIVGLIILGFSLQNWGLVIFGIIICSIGEFMVAPGYLAFISKLAPKENISAYIGCNFISYMIGLLGGSIVFGLVVAYVGVDLGMPYFFYGILISFALILFFAFIIYYRTWGQDVIERARKIREMEEGVDKGFGVSDDYQEPRMYKIFDHKLTTVVPMLLIPVVLFGTFSFGTFTYIGPEEEEVVLEITWAEDYDLISGDPIIIPGESSEGEEQIETSEIKEENVKSITFTLTWEDEPNSDTRHTNEPDEFTLAVESPDGEDHDPKSGTNPQGGQGSISITITFDPYIDPFLNGTGLYNMTISCDFCGDQLLWRPSAGAQDEVDDSNAWELSIEYEYYQKKE